MLQIQTVQWAGRQVDYIKKGVDFPTNARIYVNLVGRICYI